MVVTICCIRVFATRSPSISRRIQNPSMMPISAWAESIRAQSSARSGPDASGSVNSPPA